MAYMPIKVSNRGYWPTLHFEYEYTIKENIQAPGLYLQISGLSPLSILSNVIVQLL